MKILERELFVTLDNQGVESTNTSVLRAGTKEERTASGCLSSLSCCFGRGSSSDMTDRQCWRGHIKVERDVSSDLLNTAYLSLKAPCCGCWWPFTRRSQRIATFHFDGDSSSVSQTSRCAYFDVQRLLKAREKTDTSSLYVKVCVLTQREKWVSRIDLDIFLDELLRPGPITYFTLKGREGQTVVTLLLSQQLDTLQKEFHLKTDDDSRVDEQINQSLNDDVLSLTQSTLQVEDVHAHSQDSHEVMTCSDRSQEERQEQELWIHRSIHVAPRFRERLIGPGESFLEFLRHHYGVLVYLENSRKKMHIKGQKDRTEECNQYVRDLLAKWRREEAVADPSLRKLIH